MSWREEQIREIAKEVLDKHEKHFHTAPQWNSVPVPVEEAKAKAAIRTIIRDEHAKIEAERERNRFGSVPAPEPKTIVITFDRKGKKEKYSIKGKPNILRIERETIGEGKLAAIVMPYIEPDEALLIHSHEIYPIDEMGTRQGWTEAKLIGTSSHGWRIEQKELLKWITHIQKAIAEWKEKQPKKETPKSVTIAGIVITRDKFEEAISDGLESWEKRAKGLISTTTCSLCEIFKSEDIELHKACPLYDEESVLCCKEYYTWSRNHTADNAQKVLDKIKTITWNSWVVKSELEPCGDCIHTKIRSVGVPCRGCLGTKDHPNFIAKPENNLDPMAPKWEPKPGMWVWYSYGNTIVKVLEAGIVRCRVINLDNFPATGLVVNPVYLHRLERKHCEKEIGGVKIWAQVIKNGFIRVNYPDGVWNEYSNTGQMAVICELLAAKGIPVLPFEVWKQLQAESNETF